MSGSADKSVTVDIIGRESVSQAAGKAGAGADGLAAKLRDLNGNLDSLSHLGQIASYAIGSALGNALSTVANAAKNVVTAGFQTASSMEQADIAFTTLEKSASKAQGTLKELVTFANDTPFDTDNVVQYGEELLASGLAAGHITKTLTSLGDASGALGLTQDQTSRVMLAWTQIMNRGTVESGDLLQITEAGIPIWTVMSRALGKPVATLQDMAQKGQLVAKDVLPALERQMEKDYGGAMGKQAKTLTGLWSTLTSTINMGIATAIKPAEPAIKRALGDSMVYVGRAVQWLSTTGVPMLMAFGKATQQWLTQQWEAAKPAIQGTAGFLLNTVFPAITESLKFVGDHAAVFQALTVGVLGAAAALKVATTAMAIFDAVTDANPISLIIMAIAGLTAGIVYLWNTSEGFRVFMEKLWNAVVNLTATAVKLILGFFKGLIDVIGSIASHVPGMGWLSDMVKGADNAIDAVNAKLGTIQRNILVTVDVQTVTEAVGTGADVPAGTPPKGAGTKASSKNAGYIYDYLKKQGFSAAAAAGVVGTLQGESGVGLNPTAIGDHGTSFGIAQWHNSRWQNLVNFAADHGMNASDISTQVQFLLSELRDGGAGVSLSKLKGMTNVDAVVAQMVRGFERPKDVAGNITRRSKLAENVYTQMTGKTASGTGYEGIADAGGTAGKKQAQAAWQAAHYVGAGQGFWKSLLKNASSLNSAFTTLTNDVAKTGNKHAAAIVATAKTELLSLAKTHDAIISRLKTAQDNLKKLQQDSAQLAQQTRDNVVQSASVAAQDGDYSFGAVIERLQRGVQFATQFASIMTQLKAKGLNNDAVQQLAALSPDQGYEQAIAILQSGSGGIAQINKLQAQLGKAGQSLGSTAADSMYGAGIRAAEGLVKGLQAQQKNLERQMEILGRAMAGALKKALGIRSPSRVFAEIGGHIGSGLAMGIDGSQPLVQRSVGRLVTVPAGGSIGGGRTGTGAQTIVFEQHFHGAVADRRQVVAWVAEGLKQAPVRGVRLA